MSRAVTKNLYEEFKREAIRRIDGMWIWKLHVHPRVHFFLWKVA